MNKMICSKCDKEKEVTEFQYRNETKKYRTYCNQCKSEQNILRRYNMTREELEKKKEECNNSCDICNRHIDDLEHKAFIYNKLIVDHCHTTGKVRGMLCVNCNSALGHFKDNVDSLKQAIKYLEKYKE